MFKELLKKQRVTYVDKVSNWEEAILMAAKPLVRDGAITEVYIDAMIQSVKDHGPYIVIAPNIAMPHAQGGTGVHENSFAFMKVGQPVHFSDSSEHDAQLIFVLAGIDSNSHIGLLQAFVESVSDDEFVSKLLETKNVADLEKLVNC